MLMILCRLLPQQRGCKDFCMLFMQKNIHMKLRLSSINLFPGKNKDNGLERNTRQKMLLAKYCSSKLCGGFIGVPEKIKTMQIKKRHLMQLQLKLDNLKQAMSKN